MNFRKILAALFATLAMLLTSAVAAPAQAAPVTTQVKGYYDFVQGERPRYLGPWKSKTVYVFVSTWSGKLGKKWNAERIVKKLRRTGLDVRITTPTQDCIKLPACASVGVDRWDPAGKKMPRRKIAHTMLGSLDGYLFNSDVTLNNGTKASAKKRAKWSCRAVGAAVGLTRTAAKNACR